MEFTTGVNEDGIAKGLFLLAKIQKLNGIHNTLLSLFVCDLLFLLAKIQKLNGIHNKSAVRSYLVRVVSVSKDTKNLRKNGRIRTKCDKWLVHIPFLCYLTILLNSAKGAEYGGY